MLWMAASRFPVRTWFPLPVALLFGACAADPGDPDKAVTASSATVEAGRGDTGSSGSGSSGGSSSGSSGSSSGSSSGGTGFDATAPDTSAPDTGAEIDAMAADQGSGGGDADIDAAGCLDNIPASCPDCATMNASDAPKCQAYLMCYGANACNPKDTCSTDNDGVCGLNKVGGGSAPQAAAIATYDCACP
jgi:hypothetical protein